MPPNDIDSLAAARQKMMVRVRVLKEKSEICAAMADLEAFANETDAGAFMAGTAQDWADDDSDFDGI